MKTVSEGKNTEYQQFFVDMNAFFQGLRQQGTMGSPVHVGIEKGRKPELWFRFDRVAMNGNGFIIGDEEHTLTWKVFSREELGLHVGLPSGLSKWIVSPYFCDLESICPPADEPEEELSEEDQEAFYQGAYYPPEEDFVWQEAIHHIEQALQDMPVAVFNADTRTWTIGEIEWPVTEGNIYNYYVE
jgi:hypothetical protein